MPRMTGPVAAATPASGAGHATSFALLAILLMVLVLLSAGCRSTAETSGNVLSSVEADWIAIDDSLDADAGMAGMIASYMRPIRDYESQVLTRAGHTLAPGQPESRLGNFVADMMRSRASQYRQQSVDIAFYHYRYLQVPLQEGPVRAGHLYELLSRDDQIILVDVTGEGVRHLASAIAREGGQPVSGLRMRVVDGRASDLLVGHQGVSGERTYRLVTTHRLLQEHETYVPQKYILGMYETGRYLREELIEYMDRRSVIRAEIDNRLRNGSGGGR